MLPGELTKTEFGVWIGNYNVKLWKSTEHKLLNIWRSVKFYETWGPLEARLFLDVRVFEHVRIVHVYKADSHIQTHLR